MGSKVFVTNMVVSNGYEADELDYSVEECWGFDPPLPIAENIIDDGYLFGQAVRAGASYRGFDSEQLSPGNRVPQQVYDGIGIGEHD